MQIGQLSKSGMDARTESLVVAATLARVAGSRGAWLCSSFEYTPRGYRCFSIFLPEL